MFPFDFKPSRSMTPCGLPHRSTTAKSEYRRKKVSQAEDFHLTKQ